MAQSAAVRSFKKTHDAMRDAIAYCGSQVALAKACGVSQGVVSMWAHSESVTPRVARLIEKATHGTVDRGRFRPDVFGDDE